MFSKSCTYGLRAAIYIGQQSAADRRCGIGEISEAIGAPEPFLAKILQLLSRKGVVRSVKGPHGGFYIDNPEASRLSEVVLAIDGDSMRSGCALGLEECNASLPCPLHDEFERIRKSIWSILQNCPLNKFDRELLAGQVVLKRNLPAVQENEIIGKIIMQ